MINHKRRHVLAENMYGRGTAKIGFKGNVLCDKKNLTLALTTNCFYETRLL